MKLRFLLDTNALSEPLKRSPHPEFMRRLRTNEARIAISAVTWSEALYGMARLPEGKRREQIAEYLFEVIAPAVPVLPYDATCAEWHASERHRLEQAGRLPGWADGQIAAVASVNGLALVTRNTRDFELFEDLSLEDWCA